MFYLKIKKFVCLSKKKLKDFVSENNFKESLLKKINIEIDKIS